MTMNPYSLEVATAGNWIQFADGSKREIIDISDDGTNIIMKLDGENILWKEWFVEKEFLKCQKESS